MADEKATSGDAARPAARTEGWKWVLQTLALPVALGTLPLLYQWKASDLAEKTRVETRRRELADQQCRLYTDLMSKREDADTQVRRGLFDKLMGSYLAPNPKDVSKRLVALELLSLNFHDSLNLSPLFWELARDLDKAAPGPARDELSLQLDRVARVVKDRQAALLEGDGVRRDWDIDLARVKAGEQPQYSFEVPLLHEDGSAPDPKQRRRFTLTVVGHDLRHRALSIVVDTPGVEKIKFSLDPFDFPLVNFSRISRSERFAILLHDYDTRPEVMNARLVFLYFPSWRSGAKDKPYLDDLMARLAHADAEPAAAAASAAASK